MLTVWRDLERRRIPGKSLLFLWPLELSPFLFLQVSLLQMQLVLERKHKQDYIRCSAKTSQELSGLHQELFHSLAAVAREPKAAVLEAETRKLDESLNHSLALVALGWDGQSPEKSPLSSTPRAAQRDGLR